MNGYDVASAFRSDASLASIRQIAGSGYGQPEDRERARAAGFDRHVTKPLDPAKLRALVHISRVRSLL